MSYCREHSTSNCVECAIQEQTDRITKCQIEQTDRIIEAKECNHARRKADWPLVIAQVISVIVLVAAVVIVKT